MPTSQMTGLVQTVLGAVSPDTLGPTMTHEHLFIDLTTQFRPPEEANARARALAPVSLDNLGWIRFNYRRNRDNLLLADEDTAIAEATLYKRAGGGTIVDVTTVGIARDPLALARVARATGLNIVMGAGFYVDSVHPPDMDDRTEADLARQMTEEIKSGVGNTGIKAGIIGEIGCSWPLTPNERKVLGAAAQAQRDTGAPVLIHPGRHQDAPREILDVLAEAGADLERTIMGHLDRTIQDFDKLMDVARSGCFLEYDLFGFDGSYYPLSDADMISDAQRLDIIRQLIAEGYGDKTVVAHDICHKNNLVRYGGHGYGHILENIVPWMREKGYSGQEIQAIIAGNPANILTFA